MSIDLLTRKRGGRDFSIPVEGWGDDARVAIVANPKYFVWWYTAKSIGLGVAVGVIGFLAGKASCKKGHA